MAVQVTTEAAGLYEPPHQRAVALDAGAELVSVALREMAAPPHDATAPGFYAACAERGIAVQHILYDAADFDLLERLVPSDIAEAPGLQMIFVLGRYSSGQESDPRDLVPFLQRLDRRGRAADWALCAFGRSETTCLEAAHAAGGKLRVGFENNLINGDGGRARDNAERVAVIAKLLHDKQNHG